MIEILEGGIRAPAGNLVAAGVDVGRSGEDLVLEYWILTQECFFGRKSKRWKHVGVLFGDSFASDFALQFCRIRM